MIKDKKNRKAELRNYHYGNLLRFATEEDLAKSQEAKLIGKKWFRATSRNVEQVCFITWNFNRVAADILSLAERQERQLFEDKL